MASDIVIQERQDRRTQSSSPGRSCKADVVVPVPRSQKPRPQPTPIDIPGTAKTSLTRRFGTSLRPFASP